MSQFKKLASETAIYGVSSIVGRFLNWWLVPYYSFLFLPSEFGIVTYLFSLMAFLLIVLTYGMETGYFRFASQAHDKNLVYSTSLISLIVTSLSFLLAAFVFAPEIANIVGIASKPEYIRWIALIMAFDAITSIPFAKLRIEGRPVKFATFKLINIFLNIFLNIFFLTICPAILKSNPQSFINHIYSSQIGVGYIFISNLLASAVLLCLLLPDMNIKFRFNWPLLRNMLSYSFPILIVGVAGMITQNIDKILIPQLIPANQDPMAKLGIYGANFKLAVIMNMFIQAFRYAFEPFFFAQAKNDDNKRGYALILKYFSIFGLVIFLAIALFLDLFKAINLIAPAYYEGLKIVPLILLGNLFLGIYYTLSLWYKLTDKTRFGAYFAIIGAIITLAINIIFIPTQGYIASAYALTISYAVMMIISYIVGQKYYPVNYPIKRIALYFITAISIFAISSQLNITTPALNYLFNTALFIAFIALIYKLENKEIRQFL
ncbi:MAG: lipopolysaccharide biosynthesis protein [Mangrovibacterium sp.]